MAKLLYSMDFRKGTLIDSVSKTAGTATIWTGDWFKTWEKGKYFNAPLATYIDTNVLSSMLPTTWCAMEFYIKTYSTSAISKYFFFSRRSSSSTYMSLLQASTAPTYLKCYYSDGTAGVDTTSLVSLNTLQIWRWYHVVITREWTSTLKFYIDWVLQWTATNGWQTPSAHSMIIGALNAWATSMNWWMWLCRIYDALTQAEVNEKYEEFLKSSNLIQPVRGFRDTSVEINPNETWLVAWYQFTGVNANKTLDVKGVLNLTISWTPLLTKDWLNFIEANSDKAVAGNVWNTKSVRMRVKLGSTSEKILEGAANDKLIFANAWTLTYADFDNAFIDWVDSDTVVAGQRHDIVITSTTDVNMSAVTLALNNATYWDVEFAFVVFFSDEKDLAWAKKKYNDYARQVKLIETLDGVWCDWLSLAGKGIWRIESWTFTATEDTTSKYISCTGNWTISTIVDLNDVFENGYIKELTGDLSAQQGSTITDAASFSYANNKLSIAMTSGQKLRKLVITNWS